MKSVFTEKAAVNFKKVQQTTIFLVSYFMFFITTLQSPLASPTVYSYNTTIYDLDKAQEGYTLYTVPNTDSYDPGSRIVLIDMEGNEIHQWEYSGHKFVYAEPLLNNSHVLAIVDSTQTGIRSMKEFDWDGNVVWEFFDQEGTKRFHHDFQRLSNGNTMILRNERRDVIEISSEIVLDDSIIEVTPEGKIVWEWYTSDHYDEFGFNDEAKMLIRNEGMDWAHTNSIQSLSFNLINAHPFKESNILVSQRQTNIIFIIDKDTGQIVWKIGPDCFLTIGQHNAQLIDPGFRGAGNILLFDNGGTGGWPQKFRLDSRVIEINPVRKEIVATYNALKSGEPLHSFFSAFAGGAQRLINGNTLICDAIYGRLFEITEDGEIVWEYVNPNFWFNTARGCRENLVYRAWRVPLDWRK